ncbi:hypothetical protein BRADI_3g44146v3 [Brachypodium distachyon]|uniref:Uncharacterized protein n=1 Tax=Brachypodium distachyon TaxID=15368 RepID=A0A2K2D336_BRADI|nr:hypothetical protein BRADI_3g44146v3 [Brachypodium distachyon]
MNNNSCCSLILLDNTTASRTNPAAATRQGKDVVVAVPITSNDEESSMPRGKKQHLQPAQTWMTGLRSTTRRRKTPPPAHIAVATGKERNKLPQSRYKGVVPQPNGRWGREDLRTFRRRCEQEREHLFDGMVMPSDVGKLTGW